MQLLGETVAVGLLASSEEIARLREQRRMGLLAQLWQRYERLLPADGAEKGGMSTSSLAFAACVLQRPELASRATEQALEIVRTPWSAWIHPEAGCMTLAGMEKSIELSLTIDWLWPVLNRDQREALLGGLVAKSIENLSCAPEGFRNIDDRGMLLIVRRMDCTDPHCLHKMSEQLNNWDTWFSAALLMAACLVERAFLLPAADEPALEWGHYYRVGYDIDAARIARWKEIALERIQGVIANQFGADGDYGEGISYLGYGGQPLMYAMRTAQRTAGVDLLTEGLAHLPYWARNQYLADPAFGVANFNDTKTYVKPTFHVYANLASRLQNSQVQGYLQEAMTINQDTPSPLDLLGVDPILPADPVVLPLDTCYQRTGEVIWRTTQTRDGLYFALQCGVHGGAHQHQDRGNFYLAAYGERLLVDAGDNRYLNPPPKFVQGVSRAHNVILIDGRGQIGDNEHPVHGSVTDYRADDQRSTVLADATTCYADVAACRRRVVFMRPDLFVIADRVDGDCARLTWLAQGYDVDGLASWSFDGRRAIFKRPQAHLHLYFAEPVARWECLSAEMDGQRKQMQHMEAAIDGARATAILIPARPGETPPQFTQTGDDAVRITFRGQNHTVCRKHGTVTVNGEVYSV